MSKIIKRIILIISLTIVALFSCTIKSNALSDAQINALRKTYNDGKEYLTLTPEATDYTTDGGKYNYNLALNGMQGVVCIEGGQHIAWTSNPPRLGIKRGYNYGVSHYIEFNGDTATLHTKNSKGEDTTTTIKDQRALIAAYVMAAKEDFSNAHETGNLQYSNKQLWAWAYFDDTIKNLFPNQLGGVNYSRCNENISYARGESLNKAAEDYANSYSQNSKASMTIDISKMDFKGTVAINGKQYYKVGPFKATYNDRISDVSIYDDNENLIVPGKDGILFGYYDSNKNLQASNEYDNIRNDKQTYIFISVDKGVSGISKIKCIAKKDYTSYRGTLWVIKHNYTGKWEIDTVQDIIATTGKSSTESASDEKEGKTNISFTGDLQIHKTDSTTGKSLEGIEFKVYKWESGKSGKWVYIKSDGTIDLVDKSEGATTFTTNKSGYADTKGGLPKDSNNNPIIKNLPYGYYIVYETKIPDNLANDYVINGEIKVSNGEKITAKKMITPETNKDGLITIGSDTNSKKVVLEAENEKTYTSLQIEKKDEQGNLLTGIGFKIYSKTTGGWLKIENNKVTADNVDFDKATEIITTNGLTSIINHVPFGKYMIVETNLGPYKNRYELGTFRLNGGTITGKIIKDNYELTSGSNVAKFSYTNIDYYGTLQMLKVDAETGETLEGVSFKIYSKAKGGWLKVDKNNQVVDYVTFDDATSFTTKKDGKTDKITMVPLYEDDEKTKALYSVYETDLPEELENIYALETTQVPKPGKQEPKTAKLIKDINANKTAKADKLTNKQTYINLSGYVWQDVPGNYDNKTESKRNNLYDAPDYLINGIKVVLKDKDGNIVINGNGEQCITTTSKVDDKNGYYRFEKINIEKLEDYYVEFEYDGITYQSIEKGTTDTASKASETQNDRVTFNNAFEEITGEGQKITNLNKDEVELKYDKQVKYDEGFNTNITDVTLSNSFKLEKDKENKIVTIQDNKDSYNNGYTSYPITAATLSSQLYEQYKKLLTEKEEPVYEITNINLGLEEREKTDIYVGKDLYSVKLSINGFNHIYQYGYKSDEYYDKKNASFNVGVEFMKEKGISKYTRPIYKSDVDYINNEDKSKELKTYITYKISMVNDTTSLTTKVNSLVDYFDSRYNTEGIEVGTTYNNETGEITGTIKVASIEKYNDKYNKMIIETDSEMEAKKAQDIYVRFELSREQVAEILKGEEGNAPIDNVVEVNSYTTLKNGKVYASIDEDSIPANADPSKTTGEGSNETYEDDTDIAPSLVLTPFDDRTMSGTVFEDNAISEGTGNVRQGNGIYDEGEKTVQGVTVVMTQVDKDGNEIKDESGNTVQYTAKTGENGSFTISNYIPGYYKITYTWGKDQGGYDVKDFKATIFNKDAHQGTAWYKNETTRYSDAMDDYGLRKNIDKGDDIKLMNSTTPLFGIGIDAAGATDEGVISISDGNQLIRQDTKTMDFGIIERARQTLNIEKAVDTIKITRGSMVINDARVDENGELVGETKNLTGGPSYGYIKAEMDDEMIQGSTIEIGYKISVVNNSELDYDSEDFYHYGIINDEIKDKVVKLRAETLCDYLDSTIALNPDKEENKSWVVKPADEVLERAETLTESYFNSGISEDGNEGFWETSSEKLTQIFTQWQEQVTENMTVRSIKVANKTVLEKNLSKELEPGESVEEKISASTILSPSAEIRFENDAEIPEVTRTTDFGRNVDITKSQLYARAEWVGVSGPTGANRDYTMPIIISLSAIIVLGVGIIFIKKKVL